MSCVDPVVAQASGSVCHLRDNSFPKINKLTRHTNIILDAYLQRNSTNLHVDLARNYLLWVKNFLATISALKKSAVAARQPGPNQTQTPKLEDRRDIES